MLFNSWSFLVLLVATFALYYAPWSRGRNGNAWQITLALAASVIFYGWEDPKLIGCVVISAPLPANRFYKDSPIIQLSDWSQLRPLLKHLLADPEELFSRHIATVK